MSDACVRGWRAEDAAHVELLADVPDLIRQIRLATPDRAGADAWVAGRTAKDPKVMRSFAIERDQQFAGEVALHAFDHDHAVASVGYWLAPDARGLGLATRATEALVRWAFDELGLARIALDHRVNNPVSGRVAERCGFLFEGIERGRLGYDGQRFDIARYGRLDTDPMPRIDCLPIRA